MPEDVNRQNEPSFWLPLFVVVTGAFAAILNSSSINVAIPKLMSIFGVSTDDIQWVLTAYMLTSAVVIPIAGFLGDRFGNKRVFVVSMIIFTAGSLLCAFAWSCNSLVFFRVLQALGGGIIMPISMVIIYRIVPPQKIGLALGVWGMSAIMGPAIGPTLGGYILEHFNWHLLFIINVPVGLISIILSASLLKETPIKSDTRFDSWGFLFSTIGFSTLLLALSQGAKEGWSSYYIIMLFMISFYSLLLFALIELYSENPMLDLRLLKKRTFLLSVVIGSLINIGLFGGVFLIPLFTQNLMGLSAYESGLLLLPSALVTGVMMPVSGFLFDKIGGKIIGLIGLILTAMGTFEFQRLNVNTSHEEILIIMIIRSFGIGLAMMPITTMGMNVVAKHLIGYASSLSNVIRQVFASLGIAVLTSIMQNRQVFHYAVLSEGISYSSPVATDIIKQLKGLLTASGASSDAAGSSVITIIYGIVQKQALVYAIDDTFLIAGLIIFAAVPMVLFMGNANKSKKPATVDGS